MLSLLLDNCAPAWDRPAPAGFPSRPRSWYEDRARLAASALPTSRGHEPFASLLARLTVPDFPHH